MFKPLNGSWERLRQADNRRLDWRRKMSDHVAYALLVYTALQIFVTMSVIKTGGGSILPYFVLVVLVGAIIPSARVFESRWEHLDDKQASDPALGGLYRRDRLVVWLAAVTLPFAVTGTFAGIKALA